MPDVIKPRALCPGDTFAVVTPASPIDAERLQKGLAVLESRGFRTKIYPHVLDVDHYLAGSDQDRAAELQAAMEDPECQAVMTSRGGYGCSRLLPYLDFDRMAATGRMLMGFSDVTILHLALNRRGLVTFHTPMALTLAYDRAPFVYDSFFRLIQGDPTLPAEAPRPQTLVGGIAEGLTTGGCLCLLTDSIQTAEALETRGKILFIEDVDENPHRVDAMLTQLVNTGLAQQAAGIVVGEMTGTDERADPTMGGRPWRDIVRDRLAPLGVPTVIDFPFGHHKHMLSIPFGIRARLDADAGTLTYLESPCVG